MDSYTLAGVRLEPRDSRIYVSGAKSSFDFYKTSNNQGWAPRRTHPLIQSNYEQPLVLPQLMHL